MAGRDEDWETRGGSFDDDPEADERIKRYLDQIIQPKQPLASADLEREPPYDPVEEDKQLAQERRLANQIARKIQREPRPPIRGLVERFDQEIRAALKLPTPERLTREENIRKTYLEGLDDRALMHLSDNYGPEIMGSYYLDPVGKKAKKP